MKKHIAVFLAILFSLIIFSFKIINERKIDSSEIFCQKVNIMCENFGQQGNRIINSAEEYNLLFSPAASTSACSSYVAETIDFTKYTLIGVFTSTSGCKNPKGEYSASKDSSNNNIYFNLTITQNGQCKKLNYYKIWCIIAKVNDPNKIKFIIIKK